MAIYTYCLLRLTSEESLPDLKGIDARPVFPLRCDRYTMLASRLERDFSFSARSIVEHGQVIARVFENRTVLPMRFGTFFRSEKQVADLVRENRQELLEAFCRLRGKAEMRIKLLLAVEAPASAAKNGQARKPPRRADRADDAMAQSDHEPLDPQCRALAGQLSERLHESLHPLDQQVSCRRLDGGQLLIDCAHLIEARDAEQYQRLCAQSFAEARYSDLRVSGPWPPYHFLPGAVRRPAMAAAPRLGSRSAASYAAVLR